MFSTKLLFNKVKGLGRNSALIFFFLSVMGALIPLFRNLLAFSDLHLT